MSELGFPDEWKGQGLELAPTPKPDCEPAIEVAPVEVMGNWKWKWRILFCGGYAIVSQGFPKDTKELAIVSACDERDRMLRDKAATEKVYGPWEKT